MTFAKEKTMWSAIKDLAWNHHHVILVIGSNINTHWLLSSKSWKSWPTSVVTIVAIILVCLCGFSDQQIELDQDPPHAGLIHFYKTNDADDDYCA